MPIKNYVLEVDVENKSEAFQFVSSKDPPTAIGVPNNSTFACFFAQNFVPLLYVRETVLHLNPFRYEHYRIKFDRIRN